MAHVENVGIKIHIVLHIWSTKYMNVPYDDLDISLYFKQSFDVTEENILEYSNLLPRILSYLTAKYEEITTKIEDYIIPTEISLAERTDDWLAERRNEIKLVLAEAKKQEEALRLERELIDQEFIDRFEKRGTKGTQAARFTVFMKEDANYPEIINRSDFEEYVLNTRKLHLLQKRLSLSAIQEELAALQEEYNFYKDRLANSVNKDEEAERIYKDLFGTGDDELLDNKIHILKWTQKIVPTLEQELKDHFSVPGVDVRMKQTINAVKVRS